MCALSALTLALASPASQAQQAAQPAKLHKSYYERVEKLRDQVDDGELAEVAGTTVSPARPQTVPVETLNATLSWWQYEDDTTFIHIENSTGQPIAGLRLAFWIDRCAEKKLPPHIVYVVLNRPVPKNEQAVVNIPPSKSFHTKNEVSCLQVQGTWSN